MYNIFFNACPIFTYGLQEQPYPASTLLAQPHLYKKLTRNSYLTWKNFIIWHSLAIWHSLVIYYIPRLCWVNPEVNDLASYGTLIFCNVLAVTHVKVSRTLTLSILKRIIAKQKVKSLIFLDVRVHKIREWVDCVLFLLLGRDAALLYRNLFRS